MDYDEQVVFELIRANPGSSAYDLAALVPFSKSKIRKLIKLMASTQLIEVKQIERNNRYVNICYINNEPTKIKQYKHEFAVGRRIQAKYGKGHISFSARTGQYLYQAKVKIFDLDSLLENEELFKPVNVTLREFDSNVQCFEKCPQLWDTIAGARHAELAHICGNCPGQVVSEVESVVMVPRKRIPMRGRQYYIRRACGCLGNMVMDKNGLHVCDTCGLILDDEIIITRNLSTFEDRAENQQANAMGKDDRNNTPEQEPSYESETDTLTYDHHYSQFYPDRSEETIVKLAKWRATV